MRIASRPAKSILALLVPLLLTGCGDGEAGTAAPTPATNPTSEPAPEAPRAPEPGEQGYVAPASTKQVPPLVQATNKGNLDAVTALLETGVDPNSAHESGVAPLHISVGENMMEITKILLEKGANPDCRQQFDATPLHIASTVPHGLEQARLLIQHKADVNAKDKKGYTPLIGAAFNGHLATVELLLDAGAQINATENNGGTALHAAVLRKHQEIVAVLLVRGADVNVGDGQKNTPLHYAARNCDREMGDLLLANGADILAKTEEDGTAFQLAVFMECEELAKYLQELEIAAGGLGADPVQAPTEKPVLPVGPKKKPKKQ